MTIGERMKLLEGVAFHLGPKTMSRILNMYGVYICVDMCIFAFYIHCFIKTNVCVYIYTHTHTHTYVYMCHQHRSIDAFELWCWRRLLRVPWTARRSNQSILKEISPGCSLEGMTLKLELQYLATSCEELTHWKRL